MPKKSLLELADEEYGRPASLPPVQAPTASPSTSTEPRRKSLLELADEEYGAAPAPTASTEPDYSNYKAPISGPQSTENIFGRYSKEPAPQEKKSIGGFIQNLAESGVNQVKGFASILRHPIDTASAIGKTGAGFIDKAADLMFGEVPMDQKPEYIQQNRMYSDALTENYKQAYGSPGQAFNTLYQDPFRVASDAASVLTAGGAGVTKAGQLTKIPKVASAGAKISAAGEAATKAASLPIRATTAVVGGVTGPMSKIIKEKGGAYANTQLETNYKKLLNLTGKAATSEEEWGKNTPKILAQEGIGYKMDGNRVDWGEGIDKLKGIYSTEAKKYGEILDTTGQYHSMKQLESAVLADIRSSLKNKGSDLAEAEKYVKNQFRAYRQNYGGTALKQDGDILLTTRQVDDIKSGAWDKAFTAKNPTKSEKLLNDADYKIGDAMKNEIETRVTDANVKATNARLGDLKQAIKTLQDRNLQIPAGGGALTRNIARGTGAVIGAGIGGIGGSVVGGLAGDQLADLVATRKIPVATWSKMRDVLGATPEGSSLVRQADEILKARQTANMTPRKMLSAPPIQMPAAPGPMSSIATQEEAIKRLRELGYTGPLTADEIKNFTRPGQKRLPAPAIPLSNGAAPNASPIATQEEAIRRLREMGYTGPLTAEEIKNFVPPMRKLLPAPPANMSSVIQLPSPGVLQGQRNISMNAPYSRVIPVKGKVMKK